MKMKSKKKELPIDETIYIMLQNKVDFVFHFLLERDNRIDTPFL